jgi:hypothetical protein
MPTPLTLDSRSIDEVLKVKMTSEEEEDHGYSH